MGKGWGEGEANGVGALVAALVVLAALDVLAVYNGYVVCSVVLAYLVYLDVLVA